MERWWRPENRSTPTPHPPAQPSAGPGRRKFGSRVDPVSPPSFCRGLNSGLSPETVKSHLAFKTPPASPLSALRFPPLPPPAHPPLPASSPLPLGRTRTNSPPSRAAQISETGGAGGHGGRPAARWGADPVFCQGVPPCSPSWPPPRARPGGARIALRALSALRRGCPRGPQPGRLRGGRGGEAARGEGARPGRGPRRPDRAAPAPSPPHYHKKGGDPGPAWTGVGGWGEPVWGGGAPLAFSNPLRFRSPRPPLGEIRDLAFHPAPALPPSGARDRRHVPILRGARSPSSRPRGRETTTPGMPRAPPRPPAVPCCSIQFI